MADEDVVKGKYIRNTYYSLNEMAEAAERRKEMGPGTGIFEQRKHDDDEDWSGGSYESALDACRMGWDKYLTETLAIAESAVEMCEREQEVDAFQATWDVSGAEVDVAAFLNGEPECMIDYPVQRISKVGKVITLCASTAASCAVEPETLVRRGQVITALAIALTKLGHSCEFWADQTIKAWSGGYKGTVRTLIKSTSDEVDPSRILFAYAHPGMLRSMTFAVEHGWPDKFREELGVPGGYGTPADTIQDLPEGTIYLPKLLSDRDVPDAHTALKGYLRDLGLLAE